MPLFSIDKDKCKRDGICAATCPVGLIEIRGKNESPAPIESAEELCLNCGHYVAVCPQGALSHRHMKPGECPPVRKELILSPEHVEHFLRYRRSIRNYKKKAVSRAIISRLIDVARYAPSGHNLQPVHWLVIDNSQTLRNLAGLVIDWMKKMMASNSLVAQQMHFDRVVDAWQKGKDRILREAPVLIVAHALRELSTAQPSCLIALTYLELATTSFGLGACWAGYFNAAATFYPPVSEALALPEGHQCFGAIMVGFPKYEYHRLPLRNEPKITWR